MPLGIDSVFNVINFQFRHFSLQLWYMRKLYTAIGLFIVPIFAAAQQECTALFCNPLRQDIWAGADTIPKVLVVLLDLFIKIAMPIAALSIIYTGFTFVTSKGDPAKLKKARAMLTYLVVGLAIMLAAKGIGMAIQSTIITVAGPGSIVN
jgi:small-conductance mechanosensitive channel